MTIQSELRLSQCRDDLNEANYQWGRLEAQLDFAEELLQEAADLITPHIELWPIEEKIRGFLERFRNG